MKKFSLIFLLVIINVAGASRAFAETFNILVDNPQNVSVSFNNLASLQPIDLSTGEAVVWFNPNDEQYIEINPADNTTFTAVLDNGRGNTEVLALESNWQYWTTAVTSQWAGATLTITTQKASDDETEGVMAVTINGMSEKVRMSIYGRTFREVLLSEGNNVVKFNRKSDKTVYLQPIGVETFASVTLDGEEISPMGTMSEDGKLSFQYSFTPRHMGRVVITTDFAHSDYELFVSAVDQQWAPCPAAVKSITANGQRINAFGRTVNVASGARVDIEIDTDNYNIVDFTTNAFGTEQPSCEGGCVSVIMNRNWDFNFTVAPIDRPNTLITYTSGLAENNTSLTFRRSSGRNLNILPGYGEVKFADADNSFLIYMISANDDGDETSPAPSQYVYLNDVPQPPVQGDWLLDFADGDVLKIYSATEAPAFHTVAYSLSGIDTAPTVVKDKAVIVGDLAAGHSSLTGTHVKITQADDSPITCVKINGEKIAATLPGTYEFTVTADTEVEISGKAPMRGDLNGDNRVDSADLGIIINMIIGTRDQSSEADLTGDKKIDSADLGSIINIIVGV